MEFNVRGVSFGKRPEAVRNLKYGEAVMMIPEPENPASERALAIKKLDGTPLGYTPEEYCGSAFLKGRVNFGVVEDFGEVRSRPGTYWLKVSFEPRQVGLHVVAAPQKLESIIQKTAAFSNVNAAACTAVEGRCQITGMRPAALSVSPDWYEDTKTHTFWLRGAIYMAPELKEARDSILSDQPSPEAIELLRDANGWDMDEVLAYIGYLQDLQDQREEEDWKVDVSLFPNIKVEERTGRQV